MEYHVYIVRCSDGSLYTGIARNVEKRVAVHNSGKGAKALRGKLPVRLVYQEVAADRSTALQREAAIKKLSKSKKEQLLL